MLYADDISIIIQKNYILSNFNNILNAMVGLEMTWLESYNLSANISKTKFIQFSNHKIVHETVEIACQEFK